MKTTRFLEREKERERERERGREREREREERVDIVLFMHLDQQFKIKKNY